MPCTHGIRTREESPRSRHARRLAAGVLALVVASFPGEPSVDSSVGFEEVHAAPREHEVEIEIVSRHLQLPGDLPVTLLWRLRLSTVAIHATLWGAFALVFGELAQRALEPPLRPESALGDGFPAPADASPVVDPPGTCPGPCHPRGTGPPIPWTRPLFGTARSADRQPGAPWMRSPQTNTASLGLG